MGVRPHPGTDLGISRGMSEVEILHVVLLTKESFQTGKGDTFLGTLSNKYVETILPCAKPQAWKVGQTQGCGERGTVKSEGSQKADPAMWPERGGTLR